MSKKRGQEALKQLKQMWEHSNTEEKILQEVKEKFGVQMYLIFRRGEFLTAGDLWVILLTEEDMEKYLKLPKARFYFELECGAKLKPWTGEIDNLQKLVNLLEVAK